MKTLTLVLLLFIFSVSVADEACIEYENIEAVICEEPVKPEVEITNILFTVFWYDSEEEMRKALKEEDKEVQGSSLCEHLEDENITYCWLSMVRPKFVDDEDTLSVGHEFLHGAWGDYHATPVPK